jgi:signal transduction histidine kinase
VDLPSQLASVAADADQLEQILVNLIMNACDACSPGGRILVSAQPGVDEAAGMGPHLRIEISDDGCGIPTESLHKVFDPFFTTKKRGQGTGLGLAVVAQIVRSHGAQIEVDTEAGQGTCMRLLWPLVVRESSEPHAAA